MEPEGINKPQYFVENPSAPDSGDLDDGRIIHPKPISGTQLFKADVNVCVDQWTIRNENYTEIFIVDIEGIASIKAKIHRLTRTEDNDQEVAFTQFTVVLKERVRNDVIIRRLYDVDMKVKTALSLNDKTLRCYEEKSDDRYEDTLSHRAYLLASNELPHDEILNVNYSVVLNKSNIGI